ncbi:MAG: ATP-binding protein [bacterium]
MNDLSLHILDITQNSISAGATEISISLLIDGEMMTITIEDNGKGMTHEVVAQLSDPFFTSRTTRKVGLGIPLLIDSAEQSGGKVSVSSEVGVGTKVVATFDTSNIDCPPLGNIANAVVLLASSNPNIEFIFDYLSVEGDSYIFDTREVKKALGGISINTPTIIKYLEEMIAEQIF